MRFLKHLGRLLKEFGSFAWHNKAWWIIPVVVVLLLLAVFIVAGQAVAPFIYTLFLERGLLRSLKFSEGLRLGNPSRALGA